MGTLEVVAVDKHRYEMLVKDAERFRWLLNGHGYFMEEEMLCGHPPVSETEMDATRAAIDEAMDAERGLLK